MSKIGVIIPALNEAESIGKVVQEIPTLVDEIVVVDNGSDDATFTMAKRAGATVLSESRRGYGWACLKGIDYFSKLSTPPGIVVFMDGDYSDYPSELPQVIAPITDDNFDMVIGSRALGKRERGSMTLPQVFGNWLATSLISLFYKTKFTDLGPFRAIKYEKLMALGMKDKTYGWTVEMQIKAAKKGLKSVEVPVNYRKRVGFSKVSGTIKGTIMAGCTIIWLIVKYSL